MTRTTRRTLPISGVIWAFATTLGALLGVALNAPADQALYSVAILLTAREDPSRALAVAGSFAVYIACVALAQGVALAVIQRVQRAAPHPDDAPGKALDTPRTENGGRGALGWRWALATFAALLTYYPLLLFDGQPPFDRLGLPTAAQPGLLNAATLYGALVALALPIGVVVGVAQGLAVYGWRGWARGASRGWAVGGPWRWLAAHTLAWGFVWPLGLLLGNAITFYASFVVSWLALACATGFVLVGRMDALVTAASLSSE